MHGTPPTFQLPLMLTVPQACGPALTAATPTGRGHSGEQQFGPSLICGLLFLYSPKQKINHVISTNPFARDGRCCEHFKPGAQWTTADSQPDARLGVGTWRMAAVG